VLRQGAGDCAEGIADLGSKQTHDSNYDNGDEGENNRVLDETLTFFLWCKQHNIYSFLKKSFPEKHPQNYIQYIQFQQKFKTNFVDFHLQDC